MGQTIASRKTKPLAGQAEILSRFARLMWDRYKARVYLFGSRARGLAREYSDYDLVAVSSAFEDQSRFRRCLDRGDIWLAAGGWRKALDLHCYTPGEFKQELRGLGYLGRANARGELIRISPEPRGRAAAVRSSGVVEADSNDFAVIDESRVGFKGVPDEELEREATRAVAEARRKYRVATHRAGKTP